jgi:multicomponent Na+:H+ antiporter subunit D
VADYLGAVMVVITAITGLATAIYAWAKSPRKRLEKLGYHALFQTLIAGVTGAFLTGDVFNLYVWFEVMLIASFGLLVLGGGASSWMRASSMWRSTSSRRWSSCRGSGCFTA